jgi:hypothetical protein
MRHHPLWPLIPLGLWILGTLGCNGLPDRPIDADALRPSPGQTVSLAVAVRQVLGYRIGTAPRLGPLPEALETVPPETGLSAGSIAGLAQKLLRAGPAQGLLIVSAVERTERRYKPVRVQRGWEFESELDGFAGGRAIYRERKRPRYQTVTTAACRRVFYRAFLFSADGRAMGRTDVLPVVLRPCPENADGDVTIEEIDALRHWLRSHFPG